MSKKNNVNPDHYKLAGRERQGEDVVHDLYKRWYTQMRSLARRFIPARGREKRASDREIVADAERDTGEVHREGGGR